MQTARDSKLALRFNSHLKPDINKMHVTIEEFRVIKDTHTHFCGNEPLALDGAPRLYAFCYFPAFTALAFDQPE